MKANKSALLAMMGVVAASAYANGDYTSGTSTLLPPVKYTPPCGELPEHTEHNAKIEAKRQAKLARKRERHS